MKASWIRYSAVLLALLAALGCYEGFDRPGGGPGQGKAGGGGGGAGEKLYGFTLLDVFQPGERALRSCGQIPSSMVDVRLGEIAARVKSISTLLDLQSDNLRVNLTEIESCDDFSIVGMRAVTALPDPQVDDNAKAKLALHVRLILWYGDNSAASPGAEVLNNEWADMQHLAQLGFQRRLSVNHFALTGSGHQGFMWLWQQASDANFNFAATTIDSPPPTNQGVGSITSAVQNSAAAFAEWLKQKSAGRI